MRSDWLLFAHILSAMLLFGGVLGVATVSVAAQRWAWPDQVPLLRALAFRTNLLLVLPAFVAVHVFGDVLANREFKSNPWWIDTGFALTDIALIIAVVLALLQFWVLRRTRSGESGGWQAKTVTVLPAVMLAALTAAVVLMAGQPS